MAVEFDIELKGGLGEFFDRSVKGLEKSIRTGVFDSAVNAVGIIDDKIKGLFDPGTGDLQRSFQARFVKSAKPAEISAGALSTLAYAGIQDRGGTIFPRTGNNLAIPVNRSIPRGTWPRNFGPLEWRPIRKASLTGMLVNNVRKVKEGGKTVEKFDIQYVLKRSVTITGRQYLDKARPKVEEQSAEIIAEATARAFSKAAKDTK